MNRKRLEDHLRRMFNFGEIEKEGMEGLKKEFFLFKNEYQTTLHEMTRRVSFLEQKIKH